jgi:hypothetical protein
MTEKRESNQHNFLPFFFITLHYAVILFGIQPLLKEKEMRNEMNYELKSFIIFYLFKVRVRMENK